MVENKAGEKGSRAGKKVRISADMRLRARESAMHACVLLGSEINSEFPEKVKIWRTWFPENVS